MNSNCYTASTSVPTHDATHRELPPLVFVSLVFFGLGATGTHVYLNAWIVTVFGRKGDSAAYSMIYPIHCMINYLSYAIIALARALFGQMRFSYLFYIGALILSIILCLITKPLTKTRS